jgi:hypothetical protein
VLQRLREVPPGKLLLLLHAFLLLLAARLALATVPMTRIIRWKRLQTGAAAPGQAARRQEIRWAVLVAARYSPVRFVCFPQCLAASALLANAGILNRLHYGVKRGAAKLETHTWLEADGEIVIGGEVAGEYARLEVY